jgi:hypothetical protein
VQIYAEAGGIEKWQTLRQKASYNPGQNITRSGRG